MSYSSLLDKVLPIVSKACPTVEHRLQPCAMECSDCGALHWPEERAIIDVKKNLAKFSTCCQKGNVKLPSASLSAPQIPQFLQELLIGTHEDAKFFQRYIRSYNNSISFTSLGFTLSDVAQSIPGAPVFTIQGSLSHDIGSVFPQPNQRPHFAQIYVLGQGGMKEAKYRRLIALGPRASAHAQAHFDAKIILKLQTFMYNWNPYAKLFRHAGEVMKDESSMSLVLRTVENASMDPHRYNRPTTEDVGLVIQGEGLPKHDRHIVLHRRNGTLKQISDLHSAYLPLRYPLFFPYGSQQWEPTYQILQTHEPRPKFRNITQLEWMAYLLFARRNQFSAILVGRALHQELVVDMYACIEHSRLSWVTNNQDTLKVEMYSGLIESFGTKGEPNGKRVVLPSTFIGGPRAMDQLYQDAMAIVRDFGTPDLFITITANPAWAEMKDAIPPGADASNHPTIMARLAKLKFKTFINILVKHHLLGNVVAYVATIEFQKRGMPHMHLMLTLAQKDKPNTPERVDKLVQAEIPDVAVDPRLHQIVSRCMLHGPCEGKNCIRKGRCRFRYPKSFQEETVLQDGAYPAYKRPNNGRIIQKGPLRFDNRNVVPYNRDLSLMMNCHVNVEVAVGIQAVKYLYKYICKGHDRSYLALECKDEVKAFVDARYIGPVEAAWRIFQFELSDRFPAVQRLGIHEENCQSIYYRSNVEAQKKLDDAKTSRTMLNQFFILNQKDEIGLGTSARECYFHEIPRYFWWDDTDNTWRPRKRELKTVGRIHFASIHQGERYFLRLILLNRKNIQSWEDLKTARGLRYGTCRETADALGLLLNDNQYDAALIEGAKFKTGHQLRVMFAIILIFSPPAGPMSLFLTHWANLGDEVKYVLETKHQVVGATEEQIKTITLHRIAQILESMGSSLEQVGLRLNQGQNAFLTQVQLLNGGPQNRIDIKQRWALSQELLNASQRKFYNAVDFQFFKQRKKQGLYYLDGPGGTGKTFLLNCIIDYFCSRGEKIVPVASTGVAALLLHGGQTAHSAFKIPVKFSSESHCSFTSNDQVGRRLYEASCLIWDEAVAMHKDAIHAVDRSLQDLMNNSLPFGGKTVIFAGDFRQTLPVVKSGVYPRSELATLKSSIFWPMIQSFSLTDNVRLGIGIGDNLNKKNLSFAQELLNIGEGTNQLQNRERIDVKSIHVDFLPKAILCFKLAMRHTYNDLRRMANGKAQDYCNYVAERIILTPLNVDAAEINKAMINNLESDPMNSTSIDRPDEDSPEAITVEALNKIDFAGFPQHQLVLKVGAPIVLLRNLSIDEGLCNGTRLVIEGLSPKAISGRILSGPFKNSTVLIPKITLYHEGDSIVHMPFYRYQFPVAIAFAMTINKCQGQSMSRVALVLKSQVFAHGQLYVGLSRVRNVQDLCVAQVGSSPQILNVVVKEIFDWL